MSVELARSILHRLEPACIVTLVTPIVEMNTVNSFQHHRLAGHRGNLRTTTMKTGIDMSPQTSTSNSTDVSAQNADRRATCSDDTNASTRKAIENDAVQMKSTGDDIALLGKRHRIIRREVDSSERKDEAADYSKSEAELVDVADTLKRAIFELTEREGDQSPVSSKRHKFCCARPPVTQMGLRVLWCEGGVNGLFCTVCSSHSVGHLLFLAA